MDYKYFLAVVETGSLSNASKRLHIAPSAISRQIALLEGSIGATLFERTSSGMLLTASGQLLAQHARRVRVEEEATLMSIRSQFSPKGEVIKLISTEGIARHFLPRMIAGFAQKISGISFSLTVASPLECVRQVIDGVADIGMTFSTAAVSSVNIAYMHRSPIFALVRVGHPLAGEKQLSLSDLQSFPLAITPIGTTQRQLFELTCKADGLVFEEAFICNYSGALHEYVRECDAFTLGSSISYAGEDRSGLVAIRLTDKNLFQRDVQVITSGHLTLDSAGAGFTDYIVDALKRF